MKRSPSDKDALRDASKDAPARNARHLKGLLENERVKAALHGSDASARKFASARKQPVAAGK
jgi:ribosomal protein L29